MIVYHLSPKKNRESIKENGLIPNKKDFGQIQYGPRIFVSKDKNDLAFDYVNFENVDCWSFNVRKSQLKKDEFCRSKNYFYLEFKIEPHELTFVQAY